MLLLVPLGYLTGSAADDSLLPAYPSSSFTGSQDLRGQYLIPTMSTLLPSSFDNTLGALVVGGAVAAV